MANQSGITYGEGERPLAQLVQNVVHDLQEIVRGEVQLARTEVGEKVAQVKSSGGMFGGAAVAGLLGGMALLAAVIGYLALFMPVWASALIVAFVLLVVAGAMFLAGRTKLAALKPVPERTVETLKDDVEWAKQRSK